MAAFKGNPPPHGRQRYPWASWLNGRWHAVDPRGEFGVDPESFRRRVSDKARATGMRAITRVQGETVLFQIVNRKR